MKHTILKVAAAIITGILLWHFVLIQVFSYENISKKFASVTIKNRSGKFIKHIVLKHNGGSIESNGLNNNQDTRLLFENTGENGYHIVATFENDSSITSKPHYIEYGYIGVETITKTEIISENNW